MTTIRTFTPGPESTIVCDITVTTTEDGTHTMTDVTGRTQPLCDRQLARITWYMIETTEEVAA